MVNKKFLLVAIVVFAGCALEVPRTPTSFTQLSAKNLGPVIELESDTSIDVGTGFPRLVPRGTAFKQVGTIPQGDVFKPISFTLTLEGANVHEAFFVIKNFDLVGFYLPVEGAFVLPKSKITTKFSTRG